MAIKILFIGATGLIGQPVARELIRVGFDVTLLARDVHRTQALFPGVKVVEGDVFKTETLVTAMQGMDAAYCNLSVGQSTRELHLQPEREGISNIVSAARQAQIRRIYYLSSLVHLYEGMYGYSWWAFRIKSEAVQKIKLSGLPYTIFYPSTFMETYPSLVRNGRLLMLGHSKQKMWFISADDYARQVASSFRNLEAESRDYVIQGPQGYTWDEANDIFISNYKKGPLKVLKGPIGIMKILGTFNAKLDYAWHICEALNNYPEKFQAEQSWNELGKPELTLAEFASNA